MAERSSSRQGQEQDPNQNSSEPTHRPSCVCPNPRNCATCTHRVQTSGDQENLKQNSQKQQELAKQLQQQQLIQQYGQQEQNQSKPKSDQQQIPGQKKQPQDEPNQQQIRSSSLSHLAFPMYEVTYVEGYPVYSATGSITLPAPMELPRNGPSAFRTIRSSKSQSESNSGLGQIQAHGSGGSGSGPVTQGQGNQGTGRMLYPHSEAQAQFMNQIQNQTTKSVNDKNPPNHGQNQSAEKVQILTQSSELTQGGGQRPGDPHFDHVLHYNIIKLLAASAAPPVIDQDSINQIIERVDSTVSPESSPATASNFESKSRAVSSMQIENANLPRNNIEMPPTHKRLPNTNNIFAPNVSNANAQENLTRPNPNLIVSQSDNQSASVVIHHRPGPSTSGSTQAPPPASGELLRSLLVNPISSTTTATASAIPTFVTPRFNPMQGGGIIAENPVRHLSTLQPGPGPLRGNSNNPNPGKSARRSGNSRARPNYVQTQRLHFFTDNLTPVQYRREIQQQQLSNFRQQPPNSQQQQPTNQMQQQQNFPPHQPTTQMQQQQNFPPHQPTNQMQQPQNIQEQQQLPPAIQNQGQNSNSTFVFQQVDRILMPPPRPPAPLPQGQGPRDMVRPNAHQMNQQRPQYHMMNGNNRVPFNSQGQSGRFSHSGIYNSNLNQIPNWNPGNFIKRPHPESNFAGLNQFSYNNPQLHQFQLPPPIFTEGLGTRIHNSQVGPQQQSMSQSQKISAIIHRYQQTLQQPNAMNQGPYLYPGQILGMGSGRPPLLPTPTQFLISNSENQTRFSGANFSQRGGRARALDSARGRAQFNTPIRLTRRLRPILPRPPANESEPTIPGRIPVRTTQRQTPPTEPVRPGPYRPQVLNTPERIPNQVAADQEAQPPPLTLENDTPPVQNPRPIPSTITNQGLPRPRPASPGSLIVQRALVGRPFAFQVLDNTEALIPTPAHAQNTAIGLGRFTRLDLNLPTSGPAHPQHRRNPPVSDPVRDLYGRGVDIVFYNDSEEQGQIQGQPQERPIDLSPEIREIGVVRAVPEEHTRRVLSAWRRMRRGGANCAQEEQGRGKP